MALLQEHSTMLMSLSSASSKYFDTEEDQELLACAQVIALADGGHDFGVAT